MQRTPNLVSTHICLHFSSSNLTNCEASADLSCCAEVDNYSRIHEGAFIYIYPKYMPPKNIMLHTPHFLSISLKHHYSQTVKARDLKLCDKVHHPLCVTCHMTYLLPNYLCQDPKTLRKYSSSPVCCM